MYKAGDKINVLDRSWSFGIVNGRYTSYIPMRNLTILKTNLCVMENAYGDKGGEYSQICDLLVTDGKENFYFTPSRLCESADKEIIIRYFSDGKDVTNQISDETKRNLKAL
ncbi:unnamed protein product [marine sediment metagenome]|uniref:Uncharacterized protein n=1 Tax=marine sediment metagenome TaxID=412755 RepID=X1I4X9_9ZZZZ